MAAIEQSMWDEFHVSHNDRAFSRDVHLYELGFVDFVGYLELVAFIETRYGIHLGDEQLFGQQFTSINGISGVVWSLLRPCHVRALN